MKTCVNYLFEYFNNYLNISELDEKTVLKDQKLDKYREQFADYNPEVREWLVSIYNEYGKQVNKYISNAVKADVYFYLYDQDKDFRSLSYDCYSKLIKKLPFLRDQTEMLFNFIKEYHQVSSQKSFEYSNVVITEEISEWIQTSWVKYGVNVFKFATEWVERFYDDEGSWPASHRIKTNRSFRKYDYNIKNSKNLFNIDSMYRNMPKRPFTKGRKQEFEILMMYHWFNSLEGDPENYWQEYLEKVTQTKL